MDLKEFDDFNVDVIRDREELLFLLSEAAAFEHTVMLGYIYAMSTMKRSVDEGVTAQELEAIDRWRGKIRSVALEEMVHLTLVNNLLAALGASPNFGRPDFPVPPGHFPAHVVLALAPFNEATIQHFAYLERPTDAVIEDGEGYHSESRVVREIRTDLLSPTKSDYPSQGHLYNSIGFALKRMSKDLGEEALFCGKGFGQCDEQHFPLPGVTKVTGLASAQQAIEAIVVQGEGAAHYAEESHYAKFVSIGEEYRQLKAARPGFEPGRPSALNPLLTNAIGEEGDMHITHPLATQVVDLGNAIYALMLRSFVQLFAPNPQPELLRSGLSGVATSLMYALTGVGEVATRLPLKAEGGPLNAGLTFELLGAGGLLVQPCAALLLAERANELAAAAHRLESEVAMPGIAARLESCAKQLRKLHDKFEVSIGAPVVVAEVAPTEVRASVAPAVSASVTDNDVNQASSAAISIKVDLKRCIHSRQCVLAAPRVFEANGVGKWLHPEASTAEQLAPIAHSCPSGAVTYTRHDGGPQESPPEVNVVRLSENGPYLVRADLDITGQPQMFRAALCRCGKSRNKPFCDGAHVAAGFAATGERAVIDGPPLAERCGTLTFDPTKDGPYAVAGNVEIVGGSGQTIKCTTKAYLCRCGGSANKPFCDGTHAKIGFRSDN
jgi:CDGSH-type Zn-finger protein/uncharacterized Fe-S cluster protein YjdI